MAEHPSLSSRCYNPSTPHHTPLPTVAHMRVNGASAVDAEGRMDAKYNRYHNKHDVPWSFAAVAAVAPPPPCIHRGRQPSSNGENAKNKK